MGTNTLNIGRNPAFILEGLDEKTVALITLGRRFLRAITTGNSGIRLSAQGYFIPHRDDWDSIKYVGNDFIAKPFVFLLRETIFELEGLGIKEFDNLEVGKQVEVLIRFFLEIEDSNDPAKEKKRQKQLRKSQKEKEIAIELAEELSPDVELSKNPDETYFFEKLLPVLQLPLSFYQDGESVVIDTKEQTISKFREKSRMGALKSFVMYVCEKYKKNIGLLSISKDQELLEKHAVELALIYVKLCLKKKILISEHSLMAKHKYHSLLTGLNKSGLIGVKEKRVIPIEPSTLSRGNKEKGQLPRKRTEKLSPDKHLREQFDAKLLTSLGYKSGTGMLKRLTSVFNLEPEMEVREVANHLIQLQDNEFAYIQKNHRFEFHTMVKLFEDVIAQIDAHNTNKRWFMHAG